MASSKLLGLPRLGVVIAIGYLAGSLQSVSSWKATADAFMDWAQHPVELSSGAVLCIALAVAIYILQTLLPSRRKVFVLDFAVHNPHPR